MTKVLMIRFGADGRPLQTVVIRTGGFVNILSKKEAVEQKAWELLERITKELSLVPVDAEFVKEGGEYFLRCYIDKDGGVMIDDCEAVSRRLDPLLDEADFIEDAYTLEVSSPGLGRQLKRPRDFAYASGREVELSLFRAVDGRKAYTGTLTASDDKAVAVLIDGEEKTFSKKDLAMIRLKFDF